MCSKTFDYFNRIAAFAVVLMLLLCMSTVVTPAVYAVGEDEGVETSEEVSDEAADDGYEPTDYRWADERINEWEDRVLIAAMKPLENEGRIYYAYGEYVNELVSYFSKDDLELSKKEANDAINQIQDPANAKAGAQSGYLYQIGGKPKDADSIIEGGEYDGKLYPEFDESVRFKNESEYRNSDLYKNNKAYIDERSNTVYESKSAMREEMKQLAEADRRYQSILRGRPGDADIDEITVPALAGPVFAIGAAVILLITLAIIIWGWRSGTVSLFLGMDDESWNRGNSRKDRHRIRKISAIVLGVVIAVDLAVLYTGLTYHSTYGSNNYIEQAMDDGGVCQHGYMNFRDDVHEFLNKQNLPQNSLDLALTYRNYRFDYIKGTRSVIKNADSEVVYRGIQDAVEAQIDLMAYITKKDSGKVEKGVDEIYNDSLSTSVGAFVSKLRGSVNGYYLAGFILSMISLILAAFMTVVERHNIYRGVSNLAMGALAGTAIWGVITAAVAMTYDAKSLGLSDDAVYVTNVSAAGGITTIMITLFIISAVASVLIFVTSKIMQRRDA